MRQEQLMEIADKLIGVGTKNTTTGSWFFGYDEIKELCNVDLEKNKLVCSEVVTFISLYRNCIVSDLEVTNCGLDFDFYLNFCPDVEEETEMTL